MSPCAINKNKAHFSRLAEVEYVFIFQHATNIIKDTCLVGITEEN